MNSNQQLIIDLHEIEVNTIKKEKNFDFRTALIQLFKSLYALLRGKQNISKEDLANASEKESKRLGLEGRYNWSEIFDLEKGVTEKAEKQSDKEQKLNKPDNFYVGKAISNGSCFFDSFRQSLEQQAGVQVTIEQLRNDCKRFAQNNPTEWFISKIGNDFDEVKGKFVNRGITCDQYVNSIEKNEFWGRSDIEGRILCGKYGVKLHVLESNPLHAHDNRQDPFLHQLIDSSGSKNVGEYNKVDYDNSSVLHIINRSHAHFEPLLNRLAKQTQEHQDFLLAKQLQEQEYAQQLQEREDYSLAMRFQEQQDSLLAKEVQEQEDLLYAKQLQGQEEKFARQLQEQPLAQSLNPRCSMEEVKIEDQQQQISVK
ncbi:OTU domain-containing protein [Wolbachia endosymbiont of Oedothorax gibbosus]|nr:hypothetical protein [Wolbachia endosymbiont of Oedothorax gibbosus]